MLSVSEALQLILSEINTTALELVEIDRAYGRVLAGDIIAPFDLPPFTSSTMDGFAVRSVDIASASTDNPVSLRVIDDIPAGKTSTRSLGYLEAMRIMTGAVLPSGADAVVPLESTSSSQRGYLQSVPNEVVVFESVQAGDYLRIRVQDLKRGELILFAGRRLRPQDVGYMGSAATFTLGLFGGHGGRTLRCGDVLHLSHDCGTDNKETLNNSSFRRRPESSSTKNMGPGLRRDDGVNFSSSADINAVLPADLIPQYASQWDIGVLYGPHGAPDFFTADDIATFLASDWEVHYNSSRTGVRLIGPKPQWARRDGGEAGLHPSNIHDNAYAIGSIDFSGDMPVILWRTTGARPAAFS